MIFEPPPTTIPALMTIVMTTYPVAPTESVTVTVSTHVPTGVVESAVTTPDEGLIETPVTEGAIPKVQPSDPPV